ncbi:UNVERIFIED_ORG: hypothetical protein OKW16_001227 [Pseudomonas reinekei]|nr:hypothetical protein [Pseudomonas reinekei]
MTSNQPLPDFIGHSSRLLAPTTPANGRWMLFALVLAFIAFYLLPLMSHGLWIPDETRYAQISQEMLQSGNWISPHFMGLRYFEKPIAGYWMIAIGQAVFGDNLFGVRIASVLSTGLSVWLTWLIARRFWDDPRKSFACALLYMSFGLIAGQAGYANLDPQFTLWVNLSLVSLWFANESRTTRARLVAWMVLGIACGMGFMTKGFLAWLLPAVIALPYMLWQRRIGELLRYGPLAVVVAAAVCLPWALAIHYQEPNFWNFFFWNEHVRRFAADNAQHARPWWFYLPMLVVSVLPWAVLLPTTLTQAWNNKRQPVSGVSPALVVVAIGDFQHQQRQVANLHHAVPVAAGTVDGGCPDPPAATGTGTDDSPQRMAQRRHCHGGPDGLAVPATEQRDIRKYRDVQPVPGIHRIAGLDHRQRPANPAAIDVMGNAGPRQLAAGGAATRRHAGSDRRQQDARPVYLRTPGQPEPDHLAAEQRPGGSLGPVVADQAIGSSALQRRR